MVKFARGEDHDIKPGSVWMIKAEIAKRLTANSPDLLADAKRPDLLKAIDQPLFARLRISRNSFGPFISLRLRS
jgi:hypothetical protein